MKVDPNEMIGQEVEYVLCENGKVVIFDGSSTDAADLDSESSPFMAFCRSLDPNTTFISAFVPDDADRPVFFQTRETARKIGIHVQSTLEEPDAQRARWSRYLAMKKLASVEE